MTIRFDELPEFSKEFKWLSKKFRSLSEDLEEFKRVLEVRPLGTGKHFNMMTQTERTTIVKARLFCRYLKGSSLRIIYAYCATDSTVVFLEIYFKGDKKNEDHARIEGFLKKQENENQS